MKLWLVRHPQPLVDRGICYGATDFPADTQATAAHASRLAEVLPPRVRVFSSPLQRCESLAMALCRLRSDLAYECDERLRELDFGSWEGRRWCDIRQDEFEAWMENFAEHAVGGGESVQALMIRVALALESMRSCAYGWDEVAKGEAVWITHAGVIRAVTLLIDGVTQLQRASQWPSEALDFGQWCELTVPEGKAAGSSATRMPFDPGGARQ